MPQWKVLQSIRDFGGLNAYALENAALPAAPANRVVFLGDSITELWGKKSPFFPGEPYLNRGIAGQTTAQMLIRFRQDVIDLKPAAVIIQGYAILKPLAEKAIADALRQRTKGASASKAK